MGLYDRNYTNGAQFANEAVAERDSALVNFVKTTYKFFGASLFFAFIGAMIGFYNLQLVFENRMLIFIAEIAALFGLMFSRSKPGLNIAMLFIFTTLTGLAITPLVAMVAFKAGAGAVAMAFAMTTIIFGVMSIFGIKTSKDLANMGKMLFIALIVVVVCSLVNMFLGSSMFQVLISGAAAILFSLYVAYDTQNIIRGLYASPVDAAISLYLDFYNIFVSLLSLIGLANRD
ncbi:Bax inhibitor-1/YccA family protein [Helicobacter sp. MIT 21-1697]|uniref:Bax inhibitor-1/YccA family protein n=1 Tax=Helicobacter sp. MIT 21-1697 TaxID=2993733 RepID=UPI00224A728F|nr:Bax inhibitor-1/YccA family protein [Helicobacter sp. MIT 21-1697]MCX2716890.1 Bax inhibitor-1/YccA family protein [Helicobacter sp. MIT 21-1697]